jgi:hypothetical protein
LINPADESIFAEVERGSERDIDLAVASARRHSIMDLGVVWIRLIEHGASSSLLI